jgi:predicted amidohydrolase
MGDDILIALIAGGASAFASWRARTMPPLGWIALAPIGFAMVRCGPMAAVAGAVVGAFSSAPAVSSPILRKLLPLAVVPNALTWAVVSGIAGWLLRDHGAAWLAVLLPAAALVTSLPLRALGAPRWVSCPLACTQEPWLPAVHTARFGGELTTTALLAEASAALVLALPTAAQSPIVAAASAFVVLVVLGLGLLALERTRRRIEQLPRQRVAAVVVDGPPPPGGGIIGGHWPIESPDYRDVPGTVRRYGPHIEAAVAAGAKLLVLPEVSVYVEDEASRKAWIDAVSEWACTHRVTIVAPFFDASVPRNTLCVIEPNGVAFTYDKQHPGRGIEPQRTTPMAPGPHRSAFREWALSTVICVDLDYGDLVPPVRRAGGMLCAPSNDWLDGFEELHHRTAVWAAACTGATVVRATGHGVSAVFDGTGRVLARASSQSGPVVLIVDAPVGGTP